MCGVFGLEMENYQGDLNDIVRASSAAAPMGMGCASSDTVPVPASAAVVSICWPQQFDPDPLNFSSEDDRAFGDPFSTIRDPLLHHELNIAAATGSSSTYFTSTHNSTDHHHHHHHHMINRNSSSTTVDQLADTTSTFSAVRASNMVDHAANKIFEDDMRSPNCSIFSRIRISPTKLPTAVSPSSDSPPVMAAAAASGGVSPRGGGGGGGPPAAVLPSDMIDNAGPLQISSPRNLGIKRRLGKSQVKKVVCIPAPAAANSRSSGEVVPSDLWAWRKYGQKPIKGSPYPRGYYRCSSSKGCSARKQVERSRTDPNMLVITYTSEHNHPWPTQRNALAGSTRSHSNPSTKTTTTASASQPQTTLINLKQEELSSNIDHALSPTVVAATASVKEEIDQLDIDHDVEFGDQGRSTHDETYRPALPGSAEDSQQRQQTEDFFADLDEIEADPLNLLFSQGFTTTTTTHHGTNKLDNKAAMDPFTLFDWSGDNSSGFDQ